MGVCLDKPITDKYNEEGTGNGLRFGVSSMQGWRVEMEDTHVASCGIPHKPDWSFFAVFDGHAGASASAHAAQHLLEAIITTDEWRRNDVQSGIRAGFLKFDEEMRDVPEVARGTSGTTAVCAFVSPTKVYIANCGDSRAVLCKDSGVALTTHDHKPALPEERDRIIQAGGSVMISRVNGSLAVSRALGDYAYKGAKGVEPCKQLVSPEPEVLVWDRTEQDHFLLLACDGIWDVLCNAEACSYVSALLRITSDLKEVTNRLLDTCLAKGSYDNMTVVLVTFPNAPQTDPEARHSDSLLDDAIKRRISELVSQGEKRPTSIVADLRSLPGLLAGGGIHDKWSILEKKMTELGLSDNEEESIDMEGK